MINAQLFCQDLSRAPYILGNYETKNKNDSLKVVMHPAYEKHSLFKDYKASQPIKGLFRWGTVGALAGAGLFLIFPDEMGFGLVVYPITLGTLGGLGGLVDGYIRGRTYNETKKNDKKFHLKRDRFGYEFKLGDAGNFTNTKYSMSFFLTYRNPNMIADVLRFGVTSCDWQGEWYEDDYAYYADELKYEINGIKYLNNKLVSPYIGCGFGISRGKHSYMDMDKVFSYSGFITKHKIKGMFARPFIGLNVNVFDFMFMCLEYEYEFSTFYKKINDIKEYPVNANQMFNLIFGTYIF